MTNNENPLGRGPKPEDVAAQIASLIPTNSSELSMGQIIETKFKGGAGVLNIHSGLDDKAIALVIRKAIEVADGKPFIVIGQDKI